MSDRQVKQSGKDSDGNTAKLCNPGQSWTPRWKDDAIRDIETGVHTYYTQDSKGSRSNIHVVNGPSGKYLRSDPNGDSSDNLDNLSDC